MIQKMRLDKYLADMGLGTRSEVKLYIKKGRIKVNGQTAKKPEEKVDIESDQITMDGHAVSYVSFEYFMLNKPAGVISASSDKKAETVLDLIHDRSRKDLFPVGRLDKDTEGLMLITNDGDLAHCLLSPKKHISKVYYAKVEGKVTNQDKASFEKGVDIGEDNLTAPAELLILESAEISEVELTIFEGKFHQVKRMFEAVGKNVIYLKRLSMGPLKLDESLELGDYKELSKEELLSLTSLKNGGSYAE